MPWWENMVQTQAVSACDLSFCFRLVCMSILMLIDHSRSFAFAILNLQHNQQCPKSPIKTTEYLLVRSAVIKRTTCIPTLQEPHKSSRYPFIPDTSLYYRVSYVRFILRFKLNHACLRVNMVEMIPGAGRRLQQSKAIPDPIHPFISLLDVSISYPKSSCAWGKSLPQMVS